MPARGNKVIDPENVPIINSGVLMPKPNANKSKNPKNLFPSVATIVNIKARPGDTQTMLNLIEKLNFYFVKSEECRGCKIQIMKRQNRVKNKR